MKLLRRPGFIALSILAVIYFIIGIAGQMGHLGAIIGNVMDTMMYIGWALALAVIMSYAGYVSFGHAVFVGVGAWATAYVVEGLMATHPFSVTMFIVALLLGAALSALLAAGVGLVVLRLRGAFFAIATIGLDYVVLYLAIYSLSRAGIAPPQLFRSLGLTVQAFYWMHFVVFVITLLVAYLVKASRLGFGLAAIREDEEAAEVMGVDTFRYKLLAFAISAALAGMWGVPMAFREAKFDPQEMFSLLNSVIMIVENTVGGLGTFLGPIVGAYIYYALYWSLLTKIAQASFVVLGPIIVAIIALVPEGLIGWLRRRIPRLRGVLE
jgi:branched-chain amino acid transport system permease protein